MKAAEETRLRLLAHYAAYPVVQVRDLFKYIFQSAFGCEHPLASKDGEYAACILREYQALTVKTGASPEPLDGAYSRVPLSCISDGITPETLARLFCHSAKPEENGKAALLEKIEVARALVAEGALPFALGEFDRALDAWRDAGYPAVRHSEQFCDAYAPAYRVIANDYVRFLPLFAAIDRMLEQGGAIVAIEGGSAGGKTTVSALLADVYDCNIFHMDDFFLRPEQRTPTRLAEIGGNIDRERFAREVVLPLTEQKTVVYRPFDCRKQTLAAPITALPKPLTVVEGAYSMHPAFSRYYDLSAFLDISPDVQRKRIEKRNTSALAERFFNEWIPMENAYLEKTDVRARADLIIPIGQ